jgi:Rad3-related DNA helicase
MSIAVAEVNETTLNSYQTNRNGLKEYLIDLADEFFPFDGYRQYQDEILYEALEKLFIDGVQNVIIEGPTGIGKSPINVTLAQVVSHLHLNKREIEQYFNYTLNGVDSGQSFYTTPQKQLRNQLAQDPDLREAVSMLKSREDYICSASGDNCKECSLSSEREDETCRTISGCTYWDAKSTAMNADVAILTFAMLVVDKYIPPEGPDGGRLSFKNRDLDIVDEGHNLENQAASLFAGFTVSQWSLPNKVFGNTSDRLDWNYDRFADVEYILNDIKSRARDFADQHEDLQRYETEVEQCENFLRKLSYCRKEIDDGRPWVVTISKLDSSGQKKMKLQPVDVDGFLSNFIWSRGNKRVISSATIPFRDNIQKWADRLGMDGATRLISKPMPFPEEHRLIHKNTIVGSMSGDSEDRNWRKVVKKIKEIHSHHDGENGLIHTNSYKRAKKLAEALGTDNVHVQDRELDKEIQIQMWEDSDKDIFISPSMMEGVDLYEDRCRWQVLCKVPYPFVGDSRVSYLLNERKDWDWYMETASMDVQQSVGRAIRGPEPEEAASYYVIDAAFNKLMSRTNPPEWFSDAITDEPPEHWDDPDAAPWR